MSYADFTLSRLVKQFSLTIEENTNLYAGIPAATVRPEFQTHLTKTMPLGLRVSTEKARSEFIIAPILTEMWLLADQKIGLHSGVEFTVDVASGLAGVCDYIITRSPEQLFVTAPAIAVVEAKNEEMKRGYAQCIAEMLAVQQFDEREGHPVSKVYGAVTIGSVWQFLELEGSIVRIDAVDYHMEGLAQILGILLHMAID